LQTIAFETECLILFISTYFCWVVEDYA